MCFFLFPQFFSLVFFPPRLDGVFFPSFLVFFLPKFFVLFRLGCSEGFLFFSRFFEVVSVFLKRFLLFPYRFLGFSCVFLYCV